MRKSVVFVAVACLAVLAACGGNDSKSPATATTAKSASSGATITIEGFKFSPSPLSAKAGDSITVTNKDGTNHSVTADDGSFDTEPFSSGSKTISVATAGTIAYHCKIHSSMKGVIQVAS